MLTGEPDAGDPHVRFGGRGGANQCVVPTPIFGAQRGVVHSLTRRRSLSYVEARARGYGSLAVAMGYADWAERGM